MAGPTYTREQWSIAFLRAIGNSNPSQAAIDFVNNWTTQEANGIGPYNQPARYNLLNTTCSIQNNCTNCASTGGFAQGNISNYNSFECGVQSNANALNSGYPVIKQALSSNNLGPLCSGSSAVQAEFGKWGTGWKSSYCGGSSNGGQTFGGVASTVPLGSASSSGGSSSSGAGSSSSSSSSSSSKKTQTAYSAASSGCSIYNLGACIDAMVKAITNPVEKWTTEHVQTAAEEVAIFSMALYCFTLRMIC